PPVAAPCRARRGEHEAVIEGPELASIAIGGDVDGVAPAHVPRGEVQVRVVTDPRATRDQRCTTLRVLRHIDHLADAQPPEDHVQIGRATDESPRALGRSLDAPEPPEEQEDVPRPDALRSEVPL